MISRYYLQEWLAGLEPSANIAIDDGGVTLVSLDEDGKEMGSYLEVGGIPDDQK